MSKSKNVNNDDTFWKEVEADIKYIQPGDTAVPRAMIPIKKVARKLIESINKNAKSADRLTIWLTILTTVIALTAVLQVVLILRGK